MKIAHIKTENLRGVRDGAYSFTHANTGQPFDIVFITGPMASGKTTLLEAIAMAKERAGSYGTPVDARAFLKRGASNGSVRLSLLLDEGERQRAELREPVQVIDVPLGGAPPLNVHPQLRALLAEYSHTTDIGKWEYFPANRRLEPAWAWGEEPPPDEAAEARLRLSRASDKYRGVAAWLRERVLDDATQLDKTLANRGLVSVAERPTSLAPFAFGLAKLCPQLRFSGLGPDARTPWFERVDGHGVPIDALSDGERDAVLVVATHARIGLTGSVVLIDRPELHVAASAQSAWLRATAQLGDNQIIAATTSETLLRETTGAEVVRLG
jgi:energy-coupling factor transporter ATP-binding protein EcfA2